MNLLEQADCEKLYWAFPSSDVKSSCSFKCMYGMIRSYLINSRCRCLITWLNSECHIQARSETKCNPHIQNLWFKQAPVNCLQSLNAFISSCKMLAVVGEEAWFMWRISMPKGWSISNPLNACNQQLMLRLHVTPFLTNVNKHIYWLKIHLLMCMVWRCGKCWNPSISQITDAQEFPSTV